MANDDVKHVCVFHWEIKNPYVPSRILEAVFSHDSKTPLYWMVALRPVSIDHSRISFTCKLGPVYFLHSTDDVPTDRFEIKVFANKLNVLDFEYCHQHGRDSDYMRVEVNIYFPTQNTVNREEKKIDWLNFLSFDLRELLEESRGSLYSDLRLFSRDEPASPFQVHACILGVRWGEFFDEHPERQIVDRTVETGISHAVLKEILVYVYSGEYFDVLQDERLTTELWQVVEKYGMYDIYRMFMRGKSIKERFDFRHFIEESIIFHVSSLSVQRFQCNMNEGTDHEVGFEFEMCLGDTNTFSYLLISKSQHNLHARVILEFGRFIRPGEQRREWPFSVFHVGDYEIESNGRKESDTCSIIALESPIFITLYISDGTSAVEIMAGDPNLETTEDQFQLLSDHMSFLWRHSYEDRDLRILCPKLNPRMAPTEYGVLRVHKAIFVARVKYWKAVLLDIPEEVTEEHAIPDEVRCDVTYLNLAAIIYTIYTGKSLPIPRRSKVSVTEFARKGGLALFDYDYLVALSQYRS